VGQHLVRLGRLLELLFGLLIARIAVRVILHGHLAIRALDLVIARVAIDIQDFVIVAFGGHGWLVLMSEWWRGCDEWCVLVVSIQCRDTTYHIPLTTHQ